jgi:hypothetical protein
MREARQQRHSNGGDAGHGTAGTARQGEARQGKARRGMARQAWHGKARRGAAWQGMAWQGEAWQGRRGEAGLGKARQGKAGAARQGKARQGQAWQGRQDDTAHPCKAKHGRRGHGKAGAAGQGEARLGRARPGKAGEAGPGEAGQGQARQARQDRAGIVSARDATGVEMSNDFTKDEPQIAELEIKVFDRRAITLYLLGTTGLFVNRMSKKARETLLMGGKRDTTDIKHDMPAEFRDSIYRTSDGPTLLAMPSGAFKGSMETVTVDMPGVTKASVSRLISVPGQNVPIWGVPYLRSDVVRQAGISKTPDIRTRAFVPEWGSVVTIAYIGHVFTFHAVTNLLANAGVTIGVGDKRQEKGAGEHGLWEIVSGDDPRFLEIVATGGRDAQIAAMQAAEPYDDDTRELLDYFNVASRARRAEKQQDSKGKRSKKTNDVEMTVAEFIGGGATVPTNGGAA